MKRVGVVGSGLQKIELGAFPGKSPDKPPLPPEAKKYFGSRQPVTLQRD